MQGFSDGDTLSVGFTLNNTNYNHPIVNGEGQVGNIRSSSIGLDYEATAKVLIDWIRL
jgi:hypothetical protein